MTDSRRVVILGGHGKVALIVAPLLTQLGFEIDAVIRNPEHRSAVELPGVTAVVLDIETASVDDLTAVFSGAFAVVFSAGAGGGNPARTRAVDFEAATRAVRAAETAGVKRFVMVSYAGSGSDLERLDPDNSFYPYAKAKSDADEFLRASTLDYTILGPGMLTLEPATARVTVLGSDNRPTDTSTSRANVAAMIAHVLANNAAIRQTVDFVDGPTPILSVVT